MSISIVSNPFEELVQTFAKRGITSDEVRQLGLRVVPWTTMAEETRVTILPKSQAERIQYYDLMGLPLTFDNGYTGVRFRRNIPEGKKPKYLAPAGAKGSIAYLPHLDTIPEWSEVAKDPSMPIVIVEGEYKAIALAKIGIPTVALGGVYSFRNARKTTLARPLDQFVMEGRKVVICYDADDASTKEEPLKPYVRKAMESLGMELRKLGAEPVVWYLARTRIYIPGTKLGVDDFLAADGDIEDLIATETQFECDPQLTEMMDTYAIYTGTREHILNLKTGSVHSLPGFMNVVTADKMVETEEGKVIRVATRFMQSKERPWFDKYIFDPNRTMGFDREAHTYNSWDGWDTVGVRDPAWEDVYLRFMQKMCGEHWEFVVSWFAHIVQKPGEKTTIALVCTSTVNGSGKSMMGEIHGALLGGRYINTPLERICDTKFNGQLEGKMLAHSDEAGAFYSGLEGTLKDVVSNNVITIENKGQEPKTVGNYMRVFITTNNRRPMRLDANNRRMFIWSPKVTQAEAKGEWGQWVADAGEGVKGLKSGEGREALMHLLMNWDLTRWDPTKPVPVTDEMRDLVDASPTQNESVGTELYEELVATEKRWFWVDPATTRKGKTIFHDLTLLVKENGGQKLKAAVLRGGKTVKGYVYVVGQHYRTRLDPSDGSYWLSPGQIEGKDLLLSGVEVDQLYTSLVEGIKGSTKY